MTRTQWGGLAASAIGLALAFATARVAIHQLHTSHWMYYEQDDFFYYLKVAQNLASGRGSTFNGIVPTNGYHPLWLLMIAAVVRLGATEHGVRVFLSLAAWFATMACFAFSWLLLRRSGVSTVLSALCAAFVAVYSMHIFSEGMEVTLAVPCMFALLVFVQDEKLWLVTGRRGFWGSLSIGLVASAMVLSRLDTAILVVLLAVGVCLQRSLRQLFGAEQVVGLAVGLLPVALYLLLNRIVFGSLMPISGVVKDLKIDHGFTAKAWSSVAGLSHSQLLNIAFVGMMLVLLPLLWKRLRPIERVFVPAALGFPFAYFAVLSWTSDWGLWGWYFYGLRPALCVALLAALRSNHARTWVSTLPVLCFFGIFTLYRMATLRWDIAFPAIIDAATELQSFAAGHPGIYAMGDRAGAAAYLMHEPVVQTEGLMMDRHFAELIRQQTPLRAVLASYGVRYYVGTSWQPYAGCFQAIEPYQAGPHAPHMRGEFCQQPLARWTHDGIETLVFDTQKP